MATTTNNGWETPDDTDLVKDGALAIRTLGNNIDTSTGKGLIAWQSWAPTLSNWTNGTTGVWQASYCQIGKIVIANGYFTVGNGTKGTIMDCSIPVNNKNNIGNVGSAWCQIGSTIIPLAVTIGTNSIRIYCHNASATYTTFNQITSTAPAAWATNDWIRFSIVYEAA